MSCPTKSSAAKKAGISEKTMTRYLQDAEFSAAYKSAAAELVDSATKQMQQSLASAITRLRMIVSSNEEATTNQIAAARTLLEYSLKFRVYLKTPNTPGQRVFSRCAAPFFLEIRQYSCGKMSCSAQKFLAAGHIESFQIHPSEFNDVLHQLDELEKWRDESNDRHSGTA